MKRALAVLGVIVLLAGGHAGMRVRAQQPPAVGTARVHGRLFAADTGVPIANGYVSAQGAGRVYTARSDDGGRFELVGLIAGRFTVVASKPGFVATSYGQNQPSVPPRTIELGDGAVAEQIDIRLFRGGVIIVRVTDDAGRPLPGANVEALAYRNVAGERQMVVVSGQQSSETDDRGEFRLAGLAPDDYYLRALVSQRALAQGVRPSGDGRLFMPTYYPGSALAADARPLRIEPSQELPATIALVAQRGARVTGRVQTPPEGLQRLSVSLRPRAGPPLGLRMRLEDDGTFEARDVVPGDYLLSAQTLIAGGQEYATLPLTIGTEDVSEVVLAVAPGGTVTGRVMFEGDAPPSPGPRASGFATLVGAPGNLNVSAGRSSWGDDWTFRISGVVGTYLIRTAGAPGWYLKAVLLRDREITDIPLEIMDGRRIDGVTVVLTQKYTEVAGAAVDRTGKPVRDFTAVVFPADSSRWTPRSRFIGVVRSGPDGTFSIRGLPPGRYLAAPVVGGVLPDAAYDPRFLKDLMNGASSFTLDEGGTYRVTMAVTGETRQGISAAERIPVGR